MQDAITTFESVMDGMKDHFIYSDIQGYPLYNRFFRIRPDKGDSREDLFHIPFEEITKVKGYRYSIAGFPCLYLSKSSTDAGLSLSWIESNMPERFFWSEYRLTENTKAINVIDLSLSPFFTATKVTNYIVSALNKLPINGLLLDMIITYPLLSACSIIVENESDSFKPEYIIPQMLMGWIRKSDKFRGVAYFSCKKGGIYLGATNLAIPPVSVGDTGHCKKLIQEFEMTKPVEIKMSEIYKSKNDTFIKIGEIRDWLNNIFQTDLGIEPLHTMIHMCNSFLYLYDNVVNKKNVDIQLVTQLTDTLHLVSNQFAEPIFYEQMLNQANLFNRDDPSNEKICKNIHSKFREISDLIREFCNIDLKNFYDESNDFKQITQ